MADVADRDEAAPLIFPYGSTADLSGCRFVDVILRRSNAPPAYWPAVLAITTEDQACEIEKARFGRGVPARRPAGVFYHLLGKLFCA